MPGVNFPASVRDRFWAKVDKSGECWNWTACKFVKGYGNFSLNKRSVPAHRVAFEMENGSIPQGMMVDHVCHNRGCVRPTHLRLVTNKQNQENRSGVPSNNRSGVLGVSWKASEGRWRASVGHNNKMLQLGLYDSIEEASAAVVAKRRELFTHNELDR